MKTLKVTKKKPAIYTIEGHPWGWNRLAELAEIVDMIAEQVWDRFFDLNDDAFREKMVCWDPQMDRPGWKDKYLPDEYDYDSMLVPAGWAMRVLEAVSFGIGTVDIVKDRGQKKPEGTITTVINGNDTYYVVAWNKRHPGMVPQTEIQEIRSRLKHISSIIEHRPRPNKD